MAEFLIAYNLTNKIEGGWANNSADKGGETWGGIARNSHPTWEGWQIIDNMKNQPNFPGNLKDNEKLPTLKQSLFQADYWSPLRLGEFKEQKIANQLYDIGVNMGTSIPGIYLQRALNLSNRNQSSYPDMKVDGIIGSVTIMLTNNHPRVWELLKLIMIIQGSKYIAICENDRTQEVFMESWLNRLGLY